jgi:two-component system cell cycle response regulator DivK
MECAHVRTGRRPADHHICGLTMTDRHAALLHTALCKTTHQVYNSGKIGYRMTDPKCSVMVVDDNSTIRELLCDLLQTEGYTTMAVSTGRDAVVQARAEAPTLILLDLQMPELSGQEALVHLRQLPGHTPVVFMSAGLWSQMEAKRCGADGYLEKPFNLDRLLDLVARFCV